VYRLLISYKQTLRQLLNHRRRLQHEIRGIVLPEAQKLAWSESKRLKKTVTPKDLPWSDIKAIAQAENECSDMLNQLEKLGPFITNLNYVIRFIKEGDIPQPVAEITRLSKEQRERMWLTKDANVIGKAIWRQRQSSLSKEEMDLLKDLLGVLSNQERDVFMMVKGDGLTHDEVVEHLGISRGNVYNILKRVEEKLEAMLENQSKNDVLVGQKQPNNEGVNYLQRSLFE
jgi:RNA polymerase sigma-70 factor (ECF subfamily)